MWKWKEHLVEYLGHCPSLEESKKNGVWTICVLEKFSTGRSFGKLAVVIVGSTSGANGQLMNFGEMKVELIFCKISSDFWRSISRD